GGRDRRGRGADRHSRTRQADNARAFPRGRMILVFGSLNIDLVTRVKSLPAPGETVLGPSYDVVAGGKGANQALAAARAGAEVAMIGAVGKDAFSEIALAELAVAGVDLAGVARKGPRT